MGTETLQLIAETPCGASVENDRSALMMAGQKGNNMIRTLIGTLKTYLTDYPLEVVEVKNGYVQYFPEDCVWRLYKADGSFDRELSETVFPLSEIASIIGL